jgi:hypothetical protein
MIRTVEISGENIEVHADVGPGRILRATLVIDDRVSSENPSEFDPDDRELEKLLAITQPVGEFVDDSRVANNARDGSF